jgi:hypothetical protein
MRPQVQIYANLRSQFVTSSFWRNSKYSRLAGGLFVTSELLISLNKSRRSIQSVLNCTNSKGLRGRQRVIIFD